MTAGYTHEIDKCVAEIHKLAAAGADLVRVAVLYALTAVKYLNG